MSKKIGLLSIFVLLVGLGGVVLYFNIATLTKGYLEKLASQTLGTKVTIDRFDVFFQDQRVLLEGLRIYNPSGHGFKSEDFLKIASIVVHAQTLSGEKLVFETIEVAGSTMNFEVDGKKTNLGVIRENIDKSQKAKSAQTAKADESSKSGKKSKEDVKLIIQSFVMDKTVMTPIIHNAPVEAPAVTLPRITMRGIGERENGIVAREAVAQIFSHILSVAKTQATQAGFTKGIGMELKNRLGVDADGVEGGVNGIKSLFGK